ncbi:unnamed protein product, partial [marine sediment metagenome]
LYIYDVYGKRSFSDVKEHYDDNPNDILLFKESTRKYLEMISGDGKPFYDIDKYHIEMAKYFI